MKPPVTLLLLVTLFSRSLTNPTFVIHAADDDDDDGDDGYYGYRLPGTQIPSRYSINLQVNTNVFSGESTAFNGTVIIDFYPTEATDNIQIHAPVTVDAVSLITGNSTINVTDYSVYNSTTSILTITTEEALNTTLSYTLTIEYTGVLSTSSMTGFYRSEYSDSNGTLEYLVTSKFEPTHARYAFPAFDEPQLKATFVITIVYPRNLSLNALANTPQSGVETIDDEYEKVTFVETPVMSTYLMAFIVSKFSCTAGDDIDVNVPYQVCSRPESEEDRALAVELGPPLMKALEDITNISYSSQGLGKMDQLAIPDFASGAMENWGLIAYRETGLLWNNEESSTSYKKSIATVIAHEFTHNWFGNLVTMEWWDYIFLNEGFARFYQYFAAAKVSQLSSWELDKQFIVEQVQTVLVTDGSSSVSAMTSKASSPTQISNKFSTINYNKGASLLRMVEHVMGADNFQNGIRYYLTTYASSNANPTNLWSSLANYTSSDVLPSNVTLGEVMQNWTDLGGYPVVTVTVNGNDVILSQARFVYSGSGNTEWYVPISYTLTNDDSPFENTSAVAWLVPGQNTTLSGVLENNDWIILNNQESGYYRVTYDNALWSQIINVLQNNHTLIDVLNRAQIVDDALNLARAGLLKYSLALQVVEYLSNEIEYYPWYSAITVFNYLLQKVGEESVLGTQISNLMLDLLQSVYGSVSFSEVNADEHIYTRKLVLVLTKACKLGHEDCVTNSKSLFEQYKGGASIDRDLRTIVYCNALRYSDDSYTDWYFLWNKFQNTSLASEQLTIIAGLGCTKNITLLKYYLDQSVNSSSGIRLQDFASVWSAVYTSGPEGVQAAFEYIVENYEKLYAYYSSSASLVSSVISRFTTEEELAQVEEFIASENITSSIKSTAETALASAKSNVEWVQSIEADLFEYFEVESSTEEEETTPESDGVAKIGTPASLIFLISIVYSII